MSANHEEEDPGASAEPTIDDHDVPNPDTGAGLGAGEPNSFEPEEADPEQ